MGEPLWPGDEAKFNGHITKWYTDGPADISGDPRRNLVGLGINEAAQLRAELRTRQYLLTKLPEVAESKPSLYDTDEKAISAIISDRYGTNHGKKWRSWERAVRHELEPGEVTDLAHFLATTKPEMVWAASVLDGMDSEIEQVEKAADELLGEFV